MLYEWAGMHGIFGISAALLALDFVMRLLVVDNKTAAKYVSDLSASPSTPRNPAEAGETEQLLPASNDSDPHDDGDSHEQKRYRIHGDLAGIFKALPILYCFREPRLHMAMALSLMQAFFIGSLDATVPIESESLFGISPLQVGLVFIALMTPYLALGRYFGQAVDRYGTRGVTTLSYVYLVPCLMLLGLPGQHVVSDKRGNIALFCVVLAMNGVGLAAVSSPAFVEAMDVIGKYEAANPGLFGVNGPYAQLFGFNSLYFFAGLGLGPLVAGALRSWLGYLNMGKALAVLSALTATASFFLVGSPPRRGQGQSHVE